MPGYNHFLDCVCGWCLKKKGFKVPSRQRQTPLQVTLDSITTPNASCPVCGDQVYFYWNEAGSRVFFDELGPPWPKHPCTNQPATSNRQPRPLKAQGPATIHWRDGGWHPARYEKSRREGDWNVVYLRDLDTDAVFRVLTEKLKLPPRGALIYYQAWDERFQTSLEYLDPYFSPCRIWGWKYDRWFMKPMLRTIQERQGRQP